MVCRKLLGLFFVLIVALIAVIVSFLYQSPFDGTLLVSELEKLTWSEDEGKNIETTDINPFEIKVNENLIPDLNRRLENVRLTAPLNGIQQQYGMNTNLLKEIIGYWKTKYNWTKRQSYLNKYPQFKTRIQGLDIHFLHVKPKKTENVIVLPLLILHGWPGSIREFYDIIPLLTTPRKNYNFVFEVIAPSLPGYGFSDGAEKPGLGPAQMAVLFKKLMQRLGYQRFYVQGGDFGAIIIQSMGKLYPHNVLGIHSNMCFIRTGLSFIKEVIGSLYPSAFVPKEFEARVYPMSKKFSNLLLETGYLHIQATKPDTVGVGLGDSPAGLAAYIIEKFVTGTNVAWKERLDGGLKEKYTYDDILDNVMIYWITNSMTTAMRLYAETFSKEQRALGLERAVITSPSACTRFINDIGYQPDWILKDVYVNLVYSSDYTNAGHFAALEAPKLLADDIFMGIDKIIKLE